LSCTRSNDQNTLRDSGAQSGKNLIPTIPDSEESEVDDWNADSPESISEHVEKVMNRIPDLKEFEMTRARHPE
jgi:hypothetical protein